MPPGTIPSAKHRPERSARLFSILCIVLNHFRWFLVPGVYSIQKHNTPMKLLLILLRVFVPSEHIYASMKIILCTEVPTLL